MKKSILNLGKALNKAEQKEVNGGVSPNCKIYSVGSVPNPLHGSCIATPISSFAVKVCCRMHIPT